MLVFLSILLPSAAEQCVNDCDSSGFSLLTLKTSANVNYRAAIKLWTLNAEKSRLLNKSVAEQSRRARFKGQAVPRSCVR